MTRPLTLLRGTVLLAGVVLATAYEVARMRVEERRQVLRDFRDAMRGE